MAGLSSKALAFGDPRNKEKTFQGQRFDDDLNLNWVQFKGRSHDPQIGRFIEIDPLSEKYAYNSCFAFSENKVTNNIELEGLEAAAVILPRDATNNDIQGFYKGYNEALDRGVKGIGDIGAKVAIMALIVVQPEVGCPLAVSYLTGVPVTPSPATLERSVALESSSIQKNAANGAAFELKVGNDLVKAGDMKIAPQITIKADNGIKTRLDFISTNKSGQLALTEAKSSSTAPLTENQKAAFPSIAQNGGVVVGNGKPGYRGGMVIPPTQVNIIRPPVVDATYVRPATPPLPVLPEKKN